jgi:hypothetical protein
MALDVKTSEVHHDIGPQSGTTQFTGDDDPAWMTCGE